jgi:3',5'-cyclic AMP phosphodiesterase CpdA
MFVLAHLSDPHIPPLPQPRAVDLIGKRVTGYLNWQLRRGRHHHRDVLDTLVADLVAQRPDHVAVTGDLMNLALNEEFAEARKFLARLGNPAQVTVVPGNHDAYVSGAERAYLAAWDDYLAGEQRTLLPFPFLRRRGPLALIGLSTAVATLPFFSTGKLGRTQIQWLSALLADLRRQECFRIILIHHPPAGRRSWFRRLVDAAEFRAVIARHGADLILSGHDHVAHVHEIEGPERPVPVVQVPSISAPAEDPLGAGAYNLYRIAGAPGAMTIEMETRAINAAGTVGPVPHRPLAGLALSAR